MAQCQTQKYTDAVGKIQIFMENPILHQRYYLYINIYMYIYPRNLSKYIIINSLTKTMSNRFLLNGFSIKFTLMAKPHKDL